jgi:hypothetical protein
LLSTFWSGLELNQKIKVKIILDETLNKIY